MAAARLARLLAPCGVAAPVIAAPRVEGPNAFHTLMSLVSVIGKARETPDPLLITPDEASFIDQISSRPRALEHQVNTYRLLEASLPDIERASRK